ncbi:MAG: SPOR domain-containing protein [Treponema sp.]|nr:SPOR domain-containing protein [Treponema sp.]
MILLRKRNKSGVFCALLIAALGQAVYAQNQGAFLAEEVKTAEKIIQTPQVSGADKHAAFLRLAKLLRLSGNIEKAAAAWTDAAFAEPGKRDDDALLEAAYCFIAIGEMEKAEASIKTVLLTGTNSAALFRARYLTAQLQAFRASETALLVNLAHDANYERYKPAIYYTIWTVSHDERYKAQLLLEYPGSPEALIVKGDPSAVATDSAMWLLFPARELVSVGSAAPTASETTPRPTLSPSAQPGPTSAQPALSPSSTVLQTGLFSVELNARAQIVQLNAAGFQALLQERTVNGRQYWAVLVVPGADAEQTMRQLKQKGFDSFPR